MFALAVLIIMIACFIVDPLLGIYVMQDIFKTSTSADFNGNVLASQQHDGVGILTALVYVTHIIPGFAAAVRRLHDGNKSGWLMLLGFIPLVNFYVLYLLIAQGTPGANRFGLPPVAAMPPPVPARG